MQLVFKNRFAKARMTAVSVIWRRLNISPHFTKVLILFGFSDPLQALNPFRNFEKKIIFGPLMKPYWPKPASLAQNISKIQLFCILLCSFFSRGISQKLILMLGKTITTMKFRY